MAASPEGNTRAVLTCRCNAARCGAVRIGFTPSDTRESPDGDMYRWEMVRGAGVDSLETVPTPGGHDENYVINNGNIAIGTTTITVDGGSGTVVEGDVFRLAGDPNYYTASSSVGGATVTKITFSPGLYIATVDGRALTFFEGRHMRWTVVTE